MLVVTRKKDEKLVIGNEIEVQVLKISRDSVRIGIKAPESGEREPGGHVSWNKIFTDDTTINRKRINS